MNTFNLAAGLEQKEEGLARAAGARKELLGKAKEIAITIALEKGTVTSDDVYRRMEAVGLDPDGLGPAAGAVFRGSFEFTGQWDKSSRVRNHGSDLRVWQLKASVILTAGIRPTTSASFVYDGD